MSGFLNQQLTNVGWDALSTALGGGRLTFFKMQAGTGTIANDAAIPAMTTLVAPVYDIAITSYVIEGDGQITLFGNISSELVGTGFTFKELGVFATIEPPVLGLGGVPRGSNISAFVGTPSTLTNPVIPNPSVGTALMYSYCNAYDTADYIPGSGESTDVVNTIQVTIKIDQAENVVINILAGETFAVVNIGPPSVGPGPWSYTAANVGYFKRLVEGPGMLLSEDSETITIAQRQLTADLDLYVANGNPDISPHFSTIQKALDYLSQYLIPTTIQARIHVSRGVYTLAAGKNINVIHPNSQSITIQGPQNATLSGTSISITGSASNWSVTFGGFSSTSAILVNDWCIIDAVGGNITSNNAAIVCGFYKVTAKTGSTITVKNPYSKTSFGVTGLTSVRLTPITAIVSAPVNTYGIEIGSYGIKLLQYLGFITPTINTASAGGAQVNGSALLKFVGASGYACEPNDFFQGVGIGVVGAGVNLESCACSYNEYGIIAYAGASAQCSAVTCNHSRQWGYWAEQGDIRFSANWSYCGGNVSHGLVSSDGSNIVSSVSPPGGGIWCERNDGFGMWIVNRSSFILSVQGYGQFSNNAGGYDCYVANYGLISGSGNITGSRLFNQGIGVIGATGGLIN